MSEKGGEADVWGVAFWGGRLNGRCGSGCIYAGGKRGKQMKQFKIGKRICLAVAVLLSDIMCADVSYQYCSFQWGRDYEGWSAPPSLAFLGGVPYVVGILACIGLFWVFHRKENRIP